MAEYGYVWGPVGAWLLRERNDVVVAEIYRPDSGTISAPAQSAFQAWDSPVAAAGHSADSQHRFAAVREVIAKTLEEARVAWGLKMPTVASGQ